MLNSLFIERLKRSLAILASLAAWKDAPPFVALPPGYRSPLEITPYLTIQETTVSSTDRRSMTTATLSAPANRPLSWRCLTKNRSAIAGIDYRETTATLMFAPGETIKLIEVPFLRSLGQKDFMINCAWSNNYPAIKGSEGVVREGNSSGYKTAPNKVNYPLARRSAGRRLSFYSTFTESVVPQVQRGTWRSRFEWGRVQLGNKEIAPYTNNLTDRGVNPHPIIGGHRVLQAEHLPVVDGGRRYNYSASMIDSGSLYSFRYGYIETRVRFARAQGTVAAFWLLPADGTWPPEIDVFETGLGDDPAPASSTHFVNDGYGTSEGVFLPVNVEDGQWHIVGFDWTKDWQVTFIDNIEVARRRNQFNIPMKIVFDVSVGGLGPSPKVSTHLWKSALFLDYLKVWQD